MKHTPAAEITERYNDRVKRSGAPQQVMREIAALYDGDIIVPLPELQEEERPAIANIARQGIDQTAQRITSVFPEIGTHPMSNSKAEIAKARDRRRAFYGFHEEADTEMKLHHWARYLIGYANAPVRVRPDFSGERPWFDVRTPLGTYPNPSGDPTEIVPADCIFATRQTLGWLRRRHPDKVKYLKFTGNETNDTAIDVLEYVDAHEIVLIASMRTTEQGDFFDNFNEAMSKDVAHLASDHVELHRTENRTGMPLAVSPGAISLSQQKSAYSQVVGMYQRAAQMDALAFIATKQGILGETWLIGRPSETPQIVQPADPFEGDAGIVEGGDLQFRTVPFQYQERTAVGDLERAQRLTAGLPAELGGEAASNVRTGRRGDQLLSAVLDFPMREAHLIAQKTLKHVNEMMAAIDHEYFPNSEKTIYVDFQGEKGKLTYKPGKLWVDPAGLPAYKSKVSYFAAGLDANDRIIALGQRKGMGTMSNRTVMRHDPLVDDVEGEVAQINADQLDQVVLARVQELLANPQSLFSMTDVGKVKKLVKSGKELEDAVDQVMTEIEERAAEEAAAQQAQQGALTPEAVAPGATPEGTVPPGIAPPPEDLQNLNSLLLAGRGPSFATPQG